MPSRAGAGKVRVVTDPDAQWITVDVRPIPPLIGRVHCSDGSLRDFVGWVGLAREIERVLGTDDEGDHRVEEVP
jgi:hypothetical protein